MRHVITQQNSFFGPWIAERLGIEWKPGMGETIGLFDEVRGPVAACMYENCNGKSIMLHLAGEGSDWLNREFLWYVFYYPFEQLGLWKIIATIDASNLKCVKLAKHCGFTLEATLKDACPDGDLLIYTITKSECKWLSLKDRKNGKAESSATA